jgi:hypothetical protein
MEPRMSLAEHDLGRVVDAFTVPSLSVLTTASAYFRTSIVACTRLRRLAEAPPP